MLLGERFNGNCVRFRTNERIRTLLGNYKKQGNGVVVYKLLLLYNKLINS